MSQVIISFPPGSGGNHLKNLLLSDTVNFNLYQSRRVHSQPGNNFKIDQAYDKYGNTKDCILLGHFAEVMSHQEKIKLWPDPKFILISPDTYTDRELLHARRKKIGSAYNNFDVGSYFDGEQVFLYEPFIYRDCFATSMSNIMNISITEWFVLDISPVLDRVAKFLNITLDTEYCFALHDIWCKNNLDIIS